MLQSQNRNLSSKDIMDVINDQNMQRNLSMKNKEAEILGLLFLGDGATISITKLLNMLVPIKMFLLMF